MFITQIDFADTKDKVLVFFKLRPEVITDQNLHNNILVSSMLESPINSLYQAVRQVFAPMLLKVRKLKELYGHFFFLSYVFV